MKAFMREFREFINKGNVMDMAVGVVVGTAEPVPVPEDVALLTEIRDLLKEKK